MGAADHIANLVGAFVIGFVASQPVAFATELPDAFAQIARESASHGPGAAFVRGILCGWVIALMVWLLPSAEAARPVIVMLMTYLLAAAGLTHIIAGSVDFFFAISAGQLGWLDYLRFAVPVFAGNSLGGIVFVAMLNHAQVVAEAA